MTTAKETCPKCGKPESGPTFDDWWQQVGRLNHHKMTPEQLARKAWVIGTSALSLKCEKLEEENEALRDWRKRRRGLKHHQA